MSSELGLDLASKRLRKRSDYQFHLDYRTRWQDNDMYSHLNNPIYGVLIDSIVNEYLFTHCDYKTSSSYPRLALVANSYCDYFGELSYPGVLNIGLRVVKLGKNSVTYECGFFAEGEEKVKAVGGFVQIWVRKTDKRPPDEGLDPVVRRGLERLMGEGKPRL
ncbi:Thioesterase/thiol ester dehydrase-isomerase [Piedraia hortae CBS 480.64]|uniref:Thioesterase/thiol ester dehydrase-isomerase n=1 Tax=Piedraia hortae CBS 480.64 TaxID=1314780 RepID=A0A6A7BT55_9PEZI|nr:Thioesterase/thiol ester dehydrase-isomerase [Piedraia hortae CBS 480.64]